MPKRALLPAFVLLMAVCVSCAGAEKGPLGVIIGVPDTEMTADMARLADIVTETVAGEYNRFPVVLTPDAAIVRAAGALWPCSGEESWEAAANKLGEFAAVLRLDDVIVLLPASPRLTHVDVLWAPAKSAEARRVQVELSSTGEPALRQVGRDVGKMLAASFEAVPAGPVAPAAPTAPAEAPPAVATPPAQEPAVPAEPATPATPATPAAPPEPEPEPAIPPVQAPLPAVETPPAVDQPATEPAAEPAPRQYSEQFHAAEEMLRQGDFQRADELARRALEGSDPRSEVYYLRARIAAAMQDREAQRRWLEHALTLDGSLHEARLQLAELLRRSGLWRRAQEEYDKVLEADESNLYAYIGLAALLSSQNQPRRAAEVISRAVVHHPDDANLFLRLGDLYTQFHALPEAEEAYDRAARLSEGEGLALALDRLGDLYTSVERYHEGFVCYAEASRLRGGAGSPTAEKRYRQVMDGADATLLGDLKKAAAAVEAYVRREGVVREEAYEILTGVEKTVADVAHFAETITPPNHLRRDHARRIMGYSLAREAVVCAMTYLDTGMDDMLIRYRESLAEAQEALRESAGAQ